MTTNLDSDKNGTNIVVTAVRPPTHLAAEVGIITICKEGRSPDSPPFSIDPCGVIVSYVPPAYIRSEPSKPPEPNWFKVFTDKLVPTIESNAYLPGPLTAMYGRTNLDPELAKLVHKIGMSDKGLVEQVAGCMGPASTLETQEKVLLARDIAKAKMLLQPIEQDGPVHAVASRLAKGEKPMFKGKDAEVLNRATFETLMQPASPDPQEVLAIATRVAILRGQASPVQPGIIVVPTRGKTLQETTDRSPAYTRFGI